MARLDAGDVLGLVEQRLGSLEGLFQEDGVYKAMPLTVTLARKPLQTSLSEAVRVWGTGVLHIEACRIPTDDHLGGGAYAVQGSVRHDGTENWRYRRTGEAGVYRPPSGRWPANVVLLTTLGSSDTTDDPSRYFKVFD